MKFLTLPTWLPLVLRISATALIVWWVLGGIQPGDSWQAMRDAPAWAWFLPAIMLLMVSMIHAWRIRILLRGLSVDCQFGAIWSAILRGQFVGLALPRGGGDVARLAWLSRHTGRSDAVVAVGLSARVLELAPWMFLLFYGLTWGLMNWNPVIGTVALLVGSGFAVILITAALILRWRALNWLSRLPVGQEWLQRLVEASNSLAQARRELVWALLLTFPVALINIGVVTLVLMAFDINVPFLDVMALAPAADAVIALPLTINGIGLRESAFEILLEPLNVSGEVAVAVALMRWVGELQRAALGGVLVLIGDNLGLKKSQ